MKTIPNMLVYEQTIKHSRFIACLIPVQSELDVTRELQKIKLLFPYASHYPYAYIIGYPPDKKGYSDDSEPKGTAGIPMLSILETHQLCRILVIVIRYFGGVLLGTGGLRRAYTSSVMEALKQTPFLEPVPYLQSSFTLQYHETNALENQLRLLPIFIRTTYYDHFIQFDLDYAERYHESVQKLVSEHTHYQTTLEITLHEIRFEKTAD